MKKLDLGQTIQILANIGVVAGIVFLGMELRQNNSLMEAEARFNRLNISTDSWGRWADDGEFAELRVRAARGEELTEVERQRVEGAIMRVFLRHEWIYRELPEGSPERNQIRETLRRQFAEDAWYSLVWADRSDSFDPGFVEWVEAIVANQ